MNITKRYLTPNNWSRPQDKIRKVKGVTIHWVANPNTTAMQNRNFFESRKYGKKGYGSAHYIIDLDGSVVQCIPNNEIAYHTGSKTYTSEAKTRLGSYPNEYLIGIETCHTDWQGHYTDKTYATMVKLTASLLKEYGLTSKDIWTHQEVVGWKDCPRLFYKEPQRYRKFKSDVEAELKGNNDENTDKPIVDDTTTTYKIKSGDTLYSIAKLFNTTVERLRELNPKIDTRALQIGETIIVRASSYLTHTVKAGETLYGIANRYNVSVSDLKNLNPNVDITAMPIGTVLKIKPLENVSQPTPAPTKPTNPYPLPTGTFGMGSRGEAVKQIQRALNALNFRVDTVDGLYGSNTRNAVYRYQSMYASLTTDGVYGKSTRNQMLIDLAKK